MKLKLFLPLILFFIVFVAKGQENPLVVKYKELAKKYKNASDEISDLSNELAGYKEKQLEFYEKIKSDKITTEKYEKVLSDYSPAINRANRLEGQLREAQSTIGGLETQMNDILSENLGLKEKLSDKIEIVELQKELLKKSDELLKEKDNRILDLEKILRSKDELLAIANNAYNKLRAEKEQISKDLEASKTVVEKLSAPRVIHKSKPVTFDSQTYELGEYFISVKVTGKGSKSEFDSLQLHKLSTAKYYFEDDKNTKKYKLRLQGVCSSVEVDINKRTVADISLKRAEKLRQILISEFKFKPEWIEVKAYKKEESERKVLASYVRGKYD